jgi:hypothetical protein
MNKKLADEIRKLEARADALFGPSGPTDPFLDSLSTRPGDPQFERIALAVYRSFVEERDRIEGRSEEPRSGLSLKETCLRAALAMDATIRAEAPAQMVRGAVEPTRD